MTRRRSLFGLIVAALALVSQLAIGSFVLPDADISRLQALSRPVAVMCQAAMPDSGPVIGQPPGLKRGNHHSHQRLKNLVVPLALALSAHGIALPVTSVTVIALSPLPTRYPGRVQARAPPSRAVVAGYPRGPPFLS